LNGINFNCLCVITLLSNVFVINFFGFKSKPILQIMEKISLIFYLESSELDLLAFSDESPIYCTRRFYFDVNNPTVQDVYNFIRLDEDVTDFLSSHCGGNYQIVSVMEALSCRSIRLN